MAVVVDQRLGVELLGAQHEAARPMRTQTDGGADDAVPADAHVRQPQRPRDAAPVAPAGAGARGAAGQSQRQQRQAAVPQ